MPGRSARSKRESLQVNGSQSHRVQEPSLIEENIIESQEDEGPAPSQAMSQAVKAMANISADIVNKKVNDLVQYFLIMEQKKYPVKRVDINKVVLKEHSKAFTAFVEKAQKILKDVFGLELVETDSKQKSYILINTLQQDVENPFHMSSKEKSMLGLVMMVLSVIFMKGNTIQDSELYHFLKKCGVDIDTSHEVFGDVKKLITGEFVRQGYLEYKRLPNIEPLTHEVRWGPRAKKEVSKFSILKFVCQVYNKQDPTVWTSQFEDARQSEPQETA